MQNNYPQSKIEEFFNSLTHIIACFIFLYLALSSSASRSSLYSLMFAMMFFASFLYHSLPFLKSTFRLLDQVFIYIVIGASGVLVPNSLTHFQYIFFIGILSLTLIHHLMRQFLNISEGYIIPVLYLINGVFAGYLMLVESLILTFWLWFGFSFYLFGFYFYLKDHIKYYHTVWHVMSGLAAYFMYKHISILF